MKPKRLICCCPVILIALAIAGCAANYYEIEMTPTGQTMQRKLTCWRGHTVNGQHEVIDFPDDELVRIASAYGTEVPSDKARKHEFAGAFAGTFPDDVGGSGAYMHWTTTLGSTSTYVERARGNDDLLDDVQQRQQAADRIADLLIGWLASELESEKGFAELRAFLDTGFRRDLKNLSLYSWSFGTLAGDNDAREAEWLVRAGRYLIERSYLTIDQLPALARAVQEATHDKPARLLAFVQRFVASKMGIAGDQPIPSGLQFLADVAAIEASVNDYLRGTDEFKHKLEDWNREKATNPEAAEPAPTGALGDLVLQAFLPDFAASRRDRLTVKLAATSKPYLTNGDWDDQAQRVQWSHALLPVGVDRAGFPALLFAFWSSPDAPAQKARFGRLVLDGDALTQYCLWHRGLSQPESKEWDTFVAGLRPGDELPDQLRAFRFSHEPPAREGESQDSDLAATPRDLILQAFTDESAN